MGLKMSTDIAKINNISTELFNRSFLFGDMQKNNTAAKTQI